MRKDGSFGKSIAFFTIDHICSIKKKIKTGEYAIRYGDSVFLILSNMLKGNSIARKITIPEGYTVKMILELLNKNPFLTDEIKEIPEEASLMPNTYFYKFRDSRNSIIKMMKNEMKKVKEEIKLTNKTNLTIEQVIILASIIEKETGLDSERKLVSSVFHNRLAKKMRLQSDPTVIYAISDGYGKLGRKLTRKDWFFESPYNTYRKKGLPPAPICCPGRLSIEASLNPAKTDFLYFVVCESGKHHRFSTDYDAHRKNVSIKEKTLDILTKN
jgi:UPF0755 protein